jgi:hypothetical protein
MADLRLKPEEGAPEGKEGWTNKLLEYAHQLTVLKVGTYVGGATITTGDDGLVKEVQITDGGKTLLTVCDLIGGDITNVIDERLSTLMLLGRTPEAFSGGVG